jgi:hypothetical protein
MPLGVEQHLERKHRAKRLFAETLLIIAITSLTSSCLPSPSTNSSNGNANATSPEEILRAKLNSALLQSTRNLPRITDLTLDKATPPAVRVQFTVNGMLTEQLTKAGARADLSIILETIAKSGIDYSTVHIAGTYLMKKDQYGNTEEIPVIKTAYKRAIVEKINWETHLADVYELAFEKWTHPAFR